MTPEQLHRLMMEELERRQRVAAARAAAWAGTGVRPPQHERAEGYYPEFEKERTRFVIDEMPMPAGKQPLKIDAKTGRSYRDMGKLVRCTDGGFAPEAYAKERGLA